MSKISDQDVGAIKTLSDKWARASLDSDWERWAELITDDFKMLPPNEPAIEGKDAAKDWMKNFPSMKDFSVSLVAVDGRADFASARGVFAIAAVTESGDPVNMKGKFLATYRKQSDGSWLFAEDAWNLDAPIE